MTRPVAAGAAIAARSQPATSNKMNDRRMGGQIAVPARELNTDFDAIRPDRAISSGNRAPGVQAARGF
jgi:hypothetical protein